MTSQPTIDRVETVDLRAWVGPGENGLFIAIHGEGRTGWYGPVSDEVGRCVEVMLADGVTGEPVTDHAALHAALRRLVGSRITTAASWAIGAVDCAGWDLHGQLAGVPVANLLASSPVAAVPLYASWLRLDITDPAALDAVARVGRAGWLFTKWGLRRGLAIDPDVEAARLSRAARLAVAALGSTAAFDAVFTWDTTLTRSFADQVDPATLLWLEDPLPEDSLAAYRDLPDALPVAVGERLLIDADANANANALLALAPRAFTLDVVGCGGLTRAVDLAVAAGAADIPVFPHGRSIVPAIHLAAAFPHLVTAVEYQLQWEPIRQQLYAQPWLPRRGQITLPATPGLGVTPRSR